MSFETKRKFGGGETGSGVESLNTLTGAVTLSAGTNITLTPTGNDIEIAAASSPITVQNTSSLFSTATGVVAGAGSNSTNSIYLGPGAGTGITTGNNNVCLGKSAGASATTTTDGVFLGNEAGNLATNADYSFFVGTFAGKGATGATYANFFGANAGVGATSAIRSNFLGSGAGNTASAAQDSNFLGANAGSFATNADNSNFFGYFAGANATNADNSIFIGGDSGRGAINAEKSIFLGYRSGYVADGASYSIMLGNNAGSSAFNAKNCIFIGMDSGVSDTVNNSASGTSILIGNSTSTGGFKDSIAIGTGAVNTTANQVFIGSTSAFTNVYIKDAVIRGSAFHNNALAQGTAAQQDVRSGTYTPTLTGVTNVTSTTARKCQWMRVGNVVTVSGQMDINPTGTGTTVVGITLPVTSDFGTAFELGGAGHTPAVLGHGAAIYADATNNRAELSYIDSVGSTDTMTFTFTYEVI